MKDLVEPLAAEDIVNSDWWEAFGDPELNRLVQAALQANQDLQLAALRVEEFDALVARALRPGGSG